MNIVFLTTSDPIYLPAFFDRVLAELGKQTKAVYVVPPLYKGQTPLKAAWKYVRTFGWEGFSGLLVRTLQAKRRRLSIASTCEKHRVRVTDATDVNGPVFLDELRALDPDVIVSVSCPQIFKRELIQLPSKGCLNVHGSILPEYRGVMPSFWMLANGEKRAGVSIFFVNEEIDAGELCGQRAFDIAPDETLDGFLGRSKAVAAELLLDVLRDVEAGTVTRQPLNTGEGSYYSWPDRASVRRFRAAGRRLW